VELAFVGELGKAGPGYSLQNATELDTQTSANDMSMWRTWLKGGRQTITVTAENEIWHFCQFDGLSNQAG
jgi:hypothetical protein